jgi:hypothetical protein
MIIKNFENFGNYSEPQEKTLKEYMKAKRNRSVEIPKEESKWLLENWWRLSVISINFFNDSAVYPTPLQLDHFLKNNIGDQKIKSLTFEWTKTIFKDNDDWWWFRNENKVYKCDEFIGLKRFLNERGFTKDSVVI